MRPEIKSRFTEDMLTDISERYRPDPNSLEPLDGFESFIYRFTVKSQGRILRIGHSGRRDSDLVLGEIDWINYLAEGGANVARAFPSVRGRLVEEMADGHGERFIAAAFQEAPGRLPDDFGWSELVYENYGRSLGRMHLLTSRYDASNRPGRRPRWHDPEINDVEDILAEIDPIAHGKWQDVLAQCHQLPEDKDAFGLIHYDAHGLNFFVDDSGELTFFDFDDCNYNWFAADIAIVLFYAVMWHKDRVEATQSFLTPFMRGYRSEYDLEPGWLAKIPLFLKMREIDLYGLIHRDFDVEHEDDPWIVGYMKGRREFIHNDIPYVDMDFSKI